MRAMTDSAAVDSSESIADRLTTPTTALVVRASTGPPESPGHTDADMSNVPE